MAGFNSFIHKMEVTQEWWKLPNLPLNFWAPSILEDIRNNMGTYVCRGKTEPRQRKLICKAMCGEKARLGELE